MRNKTETKIPRRPYRKPQLEQVRLMVEEAVLASCKAVGGINPDKTQNQCNPGVACLSIGS